MSASRTPELRHRAALDGLRGIAVLAVLLFHAGVPWAQGGYLGVEIFFVLSGYLITSLLVAEGQESGGVKIGRFWGRRARRLLPALFCLVVATAIYEAIAGPTRAVPDFGADGFATLFYVANWHEIWTGSGYFAQSALVSPLQHTWSLAIEEQFYVVWPLVVLAVLRLAHKRALGVLFMVAGLGAIASAIAMGLLYDGGLGLDRVYYGTDTRAEGLLLGAALALWSALGERRRAGGARRHGAPGGSWLPAIAGVAGAVGIGVVMARAGSEPGWLFSGGMLGFDVACIAVIWCGVSDSTRRSPVRDVLSFAPLCGLGLISYGVYLWHFPLFLWLTEPTTGLGGWQLLALRLGATLVVSLISFLVIEQPIRQRRIPARVTRAALPIAVGLSAAALVIAADATTAVASRPVLLPPTTSTLPPPVTVPGTGLTCSYRVPPYHHLVTFHTCPPIGVEMVGDSVGLTLGVEITLGEQRYGVRVDNEAFLGCSYGVRGDSDELGTGYGGPNPQCLSEIDRWRLAETRDDDEVAVVELGYWDEMDWRWGSTDEALGSPAYDSYERERMGELVHELGASGRQVILLSVPLMDPGPWPNGEPSPQASPERNREINSLIASVAEHAGPNVHFLSIAPEVTPTGTYEADLDGGTCRMSDGVHFWMGPPGHFEQSACGASLQAAILGDVRTIVANADAADGPAAHARDATEERPSR